MNIIIVIGVIVGFGGLIVGFLLEGGKMIALWQISAFCIVVGGTFGATLMTTPLSILKKIPSALKKLTFPKKNDPVATINMLADLATLARKDGILALEEEANKVTDPFIRRGLMYIVDGVNPDVLQRCMENEIEAEMNENEFSARFFENMGGYSPTMGVIGTVMGMISILSKMGGDASELGSKIAVAFIATLYGVAGANLIYLPLSGHIKLNAEQEVIFKEVIVEGLMGIQEGDHPVRLKEKLMAKAGVVEKTSEAGRIITGEKGNLSTVKE